MSKTLNSSPPKVSEAVKSAPLPEADEAKPAGALAKMKAFVRKAVDCCIE